MTITIISVTEKGGAGYSSKNLYQGLLSLGINVNYLSFETLYAKKGNFFKRFYRWWDVRKNVKRNFSFTKDAPAGFDYFTFSKTGYKELRNHPLIKSADIINFHWISNLVDYQSFFRDFNKPVVWTLHDVNPFTGGCHYNFGCENYLKDCSNCPQLSERVKAFAARDNFNLKIDSLKNLTPGETKVISPSVWLKSLSEKSRMLGKYQHFAIPNSIDTAIFKKQDSAQSRSKFNLPEDKFLILFVGTSLAEHRKGFDIILQLCELLKDRHDVLFMAAGKSNTVYKGIVNLGYISDKNDIAAAYGAANVFLIPSREDNLPNTMLESLCCGTPVIGFKTGGITDAVEHEKNGFLVEKNDVEEMHQYILKMLANKELFNAEQIAAEAAGKYALAIQANAYRTVFNTII